MADQNVTTNHATANPNEFNRLQKACNFMDRISQEGLSQISSVASLAMCRIERGLEYPWQIEELYNALRTIRYQAQDTENAINSEAENVGCHYQEKISVIRQNHFAGSKS